MKKITILSACLFAGLTFAQTNLLTNGDFETGSNIRRMGRWWNSTV